MSYFPEDIPFMSKEELRENGIRIPKDATDTNVGNNSEIPNSSDAINRQDAIDVLDVGAELLRRVLDETDIVGVEREKYGWGLGLIESCIADVKELPTIQPEKAQLSQEGTTKDATSDTISKTETVEHLRRVLEATVPNTDYDEGYIDGIEFGISTVSTMPTIQPVRETVKRIIGGSCMDIGDADFSMKCAKCGAEYYHVEDYDNDYNFCPNCGRRRRRQDG